MSKQALQPLVGTYYSNILLLDPSEKPLTTVSSRRAKWYLDKGLASSLGPEGGYSDRVKLNFEPRSNHSNSFLQAILPTQCVVCGAKEGLTLHHVIPMAVKRFFPEEEKNHTRQWCVLVCEEHHLAAEKSCRPLYEKSLQEAVKAAHEEDRQKNKILHKLINVLYSQNVFLDKTIEIVEADPKAAALFDRLKYTPENINEVRDLLNNLKSGLKDKVKAAKVAWGAKFITDNGGTENLKNLFRDAFMVLEPKFLPDGFLVDFENLY